MGPAEGPPGGREGLDQQGHGAGWELPWARMCAPLLRWVITGWAGQVGTRRPVRSAPELAPVAVSDPATTTAPPAQGAMERPRAVLHRRPAFPPGPHFPAAWGLPHLLCAGPSPGAGLCPRVHECPPLPGSSGWTPTPGGPASLKSSSFVLMFQRCPSCRWISD